MEKYVEIKSPFTGGKVKEVSTVEEHEFRKEHFSIHVRYYICEDTSQRFTTTEQDELLFNELYSLYRVSHGDSRAEFSEDEYLKIHQSILASETKTENEMQKWLIYRNICRSIYNGFGQLNVNKVS